MTAPSGRTPVVALIAANGISFTGNMLTALAIPWFVLETTGSAARTGVAGFFTVLPMVLAAFFGGALIDRLGPRRSSIIADLLSGVTVALIPLLHETVGLPFWGLLVLVFLGAAFDAPGGAARLALLPDLVARAEMHLERANAIDQSVGRSAQLLGPVAAGLLIAALGPSAVLWLDAVTFAVSAGLVAIAVPSAVRASGPRGRYLDELREGLHYLWRDRLIRTLAFAIAVTNLLDVARASVVMPVYAREIYGSASALGLMVGGFGAGAVASTLLFAAIGHRLPRRGTYVAAVLLAGAPLWVLVLTPSLPVVVASRVVAGFAAGPLNPIVLTVVQERVPPHLRGRFFGVATAAVMSAAPLGVLIAGLAIEAAGLIPILTAIALVYLLVGLALLATPTLHDMEVGSRKPEIGGA